LILADDHRMVIESLQMILGCDYDIIGIAFNGDELLARLRQSAADCLLLDLVMPGRNGLELIPTIRNLTPVMKILVVTMLLDRWLANASLCAGADGFVPKDATLEELKLAINEVLAGRRYVSPRVPKSSHRLGLAAHHLGTQQLTPRQEEILLLLGEGRSETQIAVALHLGVSTITFHKHNLMRVLGIKSESALTQYAVLLRVGAGTAHTRGGEM
jgi:DNA-binding NarL/FixJ family response regulator